MTVRSLSLSAALFLMATASWAASPSKTTHQTTKSNGLKAPVLLAQAPPAPSGAGTPAAAALPGNFSLAFVDLVRLSQDYEGTKKGQSELDVYQQNLRKQLEDLDAIRFLDEKERTEITTLRGSASPSAEQQKRLQDLVAASKTRADRLRALQTQATKTDAEKAEFDRLTQLSAKADEDMDNLGSKLEEQLQTKGVELSRKLTDTVSVAIEATAKEKGFTAVVDKKAVLFGGIDITDDVLKRLNAQK